MSHLRHSWEPSGGGSILEKTKAGDIGGIGGSLFNLASTFSAPRQCYVTNWRLGLFYRSCQILTLFYVFYEMLNAFTFLSQDMPQGVVNGWVEENTLWSDYTSSDPNYCSSPYTDDYAYPYNWTYDYREVKCTQLPVSQMGIKAMPTKMFYTTFFHEATTTTKRCSENSVLCNSSSTGVVIHNDVCMCEDWQNYYTVNPEGLKQVIEFEFLSKYLTGGTSGTADIEGGGGEFSNLKVTTVVRRENSEENLYTFPPGSYVGLTVAQMLAVADVDLNDFNEGTAYTVGGSTNQAARYRMTGVQLSVDLDFTNFKEVEHADGKVTGWQRHNIVCFMTIREAGFEWSSWGNDVIDMVYNGFVAQNPAAGSSEMKMSEEVTIDRYRYGVQVVFTSRGEFGTFVFSEFVNTFVQGLVLLTTATTVTMLAAPFIGGTDGAIFVRFCQTHCKPDDVIARTVATAALQAGSFVNHLDHEYSGHLQKHSLYHKLQLLLHRDLNDAQIAEVCEDACKCADLDGDGECAIDEFCNFISSSDADLTDVINKYQTSDGLPQKAQEFNSMDMHENDKKLQRIATSLRASGMGARPNRRPTFGGGARVAPAPPAPAFQQPGPAHVVVVHSAPPPPPPPGGPPAAGVVPPPPLFVPAPPAPPVPPAQGGSFQPFAADGSRRAPGY